MSEPDEPLDRSGPLPPRAPRPFVVHWLVASACALLAVLFPVLLTNIPLAAAIAVALLAGLVAAPRLARNEAAALDARRARWLEAGGDRREAGGDPREAGGDSREAGGDSPGGDA